MPKGIHKNGVPTEGQVKRAVARGHAAMTEAEQSLTELRDLTVILQNARDEATGRLAQLLQGGPPPSMLGAQVNASPRKF